jgi:methionyl-tRNA synthetase
MRTFYLTTPIYYPNARPHVGSAYTTIVCDVLARYKRMCGYDVAFLTGTDEHGEKLERAAAAAGQSPSQFVAEKRKLFVQLWEKLGIPVTVYPYADGKPESLRFINTTHPDHERSVQRLLIRARERGFVDKRRYEGRYCIFDERYISEGTDAVNCDICGRPAELISEENYFFKLSGFQDRLLELYDKHPEFVQPDYRRNEVKSFVKSGLRDISISRKRLKWGIPWPDDPEQVFYVWYDALTSYMTGIGYAQGENGNAEFQKYWRNKPGESELVHMMAKDILRFHAVYWPAFIMAAYPDQPEMLPTTVFAHGWIYYEQDKMSKSKGNVVYPEPIIDALESFGAPGNDGLRYYLLREAPFGQDTSFSYEGLIQRYNSDLANGLGNLASRTLAMIAKYCDGEIPCMPPTLDGLWRERRAEVSREEFVKNINYAYGNFQFSNVAEQIWGIVAHYGDEFLAHYQPWAIAQDPAKRPLLDGVLFIALEAVRAVAVLAHPILPQATQRIWKMLGCEGYLGKIEDQRIDQLKWGELRPGTKVGKPEPIFPRLDKAVTLAKLDELAETDRERGKPAVGALREAPLQANLAEADRNRDKPKEALIPVQTENKPEAAATSAPESQAPSPQPLAPSLISIEDFAKVDMRVGEVKAAEHVPGATKLLKLMVDIGTEVRQLVAGLAEYYQPENLIGMKVVVVTNLQPRKLRGVESNGMIVAASVGDHGRPVLVTFKEEVENGARLK